MAACSRRPSPSFAELRRSWPPTSPTTPTSGFRAQLCGDAHLANFGAFAAPDRKLVFDLNDFDETLPGPWEWDIKRLAASIAVGGSRSRLARWTSGRDDRAVRAYRLAMRRFAAMRTIDVWYARLDVEDAAGTLGPSVQVPARKRLERTVAKARQGQPPGLRQADDEVDGEPRIISDPPLVVPFDELITATKRRRSREELVRVYEAYRATLRPTAATCSSGYRRRHRAQGRRRRERRHARLDRRCSSATTPGIRSFLQIKEASSRCSSLTPGAVSPASGQRVVEGQRLMQAASDIFLGWTRATATSTASARLLRAPALGLEGLGADRDDDARAGCADYAEICGWTLARAHARSGDRVAIAAYLGDKGQLRRALAEFPRPTPTRTSATTPPWSQR